MEDNTMSQGTAADEQQEEKLYTKEEVTQIVSSRLARAKLDASQSKGFQDREAALNRRELELDAREALAEAGLSKDLVSAINCSDKETMLKSIQTLKALYGSAGPAGPKYRVSTGISNTSNGSGYRKDEDADIRKAMGLKG